MDIQFDDCDGIFSFVLRYLVFKLVPRFERLIMRVSRLEPVGTCRKISKTCADLRVDRAALSAGVGAGLDAQLKCVDAAFLSAFYPRSGPYICRRLSVYLHPFNVLCTISRHWHGSCSYARRVLRADRCKQRQSRVASDDRNH